ncbi:hypothetical protein [Kitasatospora sp. LaBMicrA B282]|uniref:hypothetical protein n=1 Tax=Kitasatospora sp. LaBMicrA B282 TaxID=3420949 RepID=UPI003D10C3D0
MPHPKFRRWAIGLVGVGAASLLTAVPAHAASAVDGSISRDEVIQRAQSWVTEGVPYDQGSNYSDSNGSYREDCSGYVSMAWHLDDSLVTQTLPSVSTQIASSQLQPGDALDYTDEHVILFGGWIDQNAGTFNYYSEQNPSVLTSEYQGNLNSSSVAGWPTSYYTPLRYNNISGTASATTAPATPAPGTATPAPSTGGTSTGSTGSTGTGTGTGTGTSGTGGTGSYAHSHYAHPHHGKSWFAINRWW